ncbi:MAG: hypothetical protein HY353_02905 [Candidatus Omnitrophica bacterium]|nr:hypothetical protein [Candidatus Omnitrophota bacterium]
MWSVALLAPVAWAACLWYARRNPEALIALTREDGVLENVQALLFGVSALVSAAIAGTLFHRRRWPLALLYAVASAALVWVTGEELSWGQRLFGWTTPDWMAARNLQGETNLHNLVGLEWLVYRTMYAGAILAVLVSWAGWGWKRRWLERAQAMWWVPHPVVIPALLCYLSGMSGILEPLTKPWYLPHQWALVFRGLMEIRESFLVWAVLVFLVMVWQALSATERSRA